MSLRANRLDVTTGTRRAVEAPEFFAERAHGDVATPDGVAHPADLDGTQLLVTEIFSEFGGSSQYLQ